MTLRRTVVKASLALSTISIFSSGPVKDTFAETGSAIKGKNMNRGKKIVDHFMWAAVDLDVASAEFEVLTGVRPEFGGRHPGFGTHNALVSLANGSYMEVLALDPQQTADNPIVREIAELHSPEILAFHLQRSDLESLVETLREFDIPFTGPLDLGRKRPDGTELRWRLLFPESPIFKHALPIFIDWMDAPHPSESAPGGCELTNFEVGHPESDDLKSIYQQLGVDVPVIQSAKAYAKATLNTPKGEISLEGAL